MKDTTEASQHIPRTEYQPVPIPANIWQKLLAETLGTFALTLVASGSTMIEAIFHQAFSQPAHFVASGLIVMVMIYTMGHVSGAHFNPAITLAFALRRDFPWKRVPSYWIAQIVGSLGAALLLLALFGNVEYMGKPMPHMAVGISFCIEILLSFLLVLVVLGVSSKGELSGNNVAIAVGSTIILCGLFAGEVSGASMNPARALGPYLISGSWSSLWIYLLAPFVGSLPAVTVAYLFRQKSNPIEQKAAQGEG